jgi:creatinine amidohydrolase|tara:strand:+ start:175 stop:975 length:801 start_codon:yes stop_codon:yes gene_type:complete
MQFSSRKFENLTQPEIAKTLKENPLVILPTGSVEQHGSHLPAGTDIFAAEAISEEVAKLMNGLILPGGTLGVTPMHMPYEATISLSPETYMNLIFDVCKSAAIHGAKKLLVINWHEGNIPSLSITCEKLHREVGLSVLIAQACYVAAEMYGPDCGGLTHGGEIEALAVLSHRPELVHLDRISQSSDQTIGSKMDRLRRTKEYQPILTDIRTIAASGWYGNPEHATIQKGQKMLLDVSKAIAKEANEILELLEQTQGSPLKLKSLSR